MRTPSIPRRWLIALAVLYVLIVLYAIVVMQQILLGVFLPLLVVAVFYLAWRVWRVFRLHERRLEQAVDEADDPVTVAEPDGTEDPVAALKARYTSGELSEAAFERELERLLDDPADEAVNESEGERERADDTTG